VPARKAGEPEPRTEEGGRIAGEMMMKARTERIKKELLERRSDVARLMRMDGTFSESPLASDNLPDVLAELDEDDDDENSGLHNQP
jgi:hypothetical protein